MKKLLIVTLLAAVSLNMLSQPYVFYKRNKMTIATLDSPTVTTESFPATEKEQHKVEVRFPGNEAWNFSVQLKKIANDSSLTAAADTILFLSDMEGEFARLRHFLISNNVIDEKYNWIFGTNELVICGDLFDRGTAVTQQLWLLYMLESEAKAKGGSVHIVLGNHEIMNLSGDVRYVQPRYFDHANLLGRDYTQLFDQNTELGQWLRSKNIIEKTGRFLCMHGGMSPQVLWRKLSIDYINDMVRPWYARQKSDMPDAISVFFSDNSPFWYRGYFDNPPAEQKLVTSTLAHYDADKIIVGHTMKHFVGPYYDGKVWDINTDWHAGNAQGLLVEKDKYYRVDENGLRTQVQ
jgi:hypothetical protein